MAETDINTGFEKPMATTQEVPGFVKPEVVTTTPMEEVKKDIIKRNTPSVFDIQKNRQSKRKINNSFLEGGDKMQLTNTSARFDEMYVGIGDEFISVYDNFLAGADNNERSAAMQTTGDKWENGLAKAGVNFATTVAGTTIGAVTGAINAIQEGEWSGFYTDDFNIWLDQVNQKLNYKLPNYYSAQEKEEGFFESLDNANFWANDFAGGVSFTLGAIVGEAIWATVTGGASLATTTARLGLKGAKAAKVARGISKWSDLGKTMVRKGYLNAKKVRVLGRVGEVANAGRFMYTSAGYEAGVEARQLMMSATKNFENTIQQQHGRPPTAEERSKFEERLTVAANSAYGANLALVGASNLAIFGKMFNITTPISRAWKASKKGLNKSVFGIGTEVATEGGRLTRTALNATKTQKVLGYTTSILKSPIIEGVWEEGQQSVVHNTAENWLDSGYNIEATKNTYGLTESLYDGYAQTYGTKEGWKEIGLGMMVGLIGGGVSGQYKSYSQALKSEAQYADLINDSEVGTSILTDRMFAANQMYKANKDEVAAQEKGDFVGQRNARKRSILSTVRVHEKYGKMDEAFEDFKTSIALVDSEKIAEENNLEVEEVEAYKEAVIEEYRETQREYQDNIDFARYIVGKGTTTKDLEGMTVANERIDKEWVAGAIAYNMSMGKDSAETADIILEQIKQGVGTIVTGTTAQEFEKGIGIRDALARTTKEKRANLRKVQARREHLLNLEKDVKSEIKDSQKIIARSESQEEKQRLQANLITLATQLEQINLDKQKADEEVELAYQSIQLESHAPSIGDKITAEDLAKVVEIEGGEIVGGTLFKIDEALQSIRETNPKKYEEMKKLFHEYQKAVYSFKEFNKTMEGLTQEDFSPADFNTKLQRLLGKNKNATEFTREFFANVGNQMFMNFNGEQLGAEQETEQTTTEGDNIDTTEIETITNEEFKNFVDTGEVSDKVINNIAKKVENNAELTKEELAVYQNKSKEVEAVIKKNEPSTVDKLKNLIKQSLKKNTLIAEYLTPTQEGQPTQKEVDRYKELHEKAMQGNFPPSVLLEEDPAKLIKESSSQTTLTEEELVEFQNLNEKLSNWQITEGTMVDGVNSSLADLIVRLGLLQQQPETNNTQETINNNDAIKIEKASDKNSSVTRDSKDMIQTPQGVYLNVDRGTYSLSHITVVHLWSKLGGEGEIFIKRKGQEEESADLETIEKYQKEEGTIFKIKQGDDVIEFKIGPKSRIEFQGTTWKEIENKLDIKFITAEGVEPSSQSYILGYDVDENGSKPTQSSFEIKTSKKNTMPTMTEEELHSVKKVTAIVDPENEYNKKLLDKVKRAKTEESKKAAEEALENEVVVYLVKDNKIAGILRGGGIQNLGKSDSSINYGLIRNRAAQALKQEETTDLININVTVPISFTYKGSPIFRLKEVDGQVVLDSKLITEEELQLITDVGYVQNGELTTKNGGENINTSYLPKTTEKLPIVVFEHRGERIAFPVSLSQSNVDLTQQLEGLLQLQNITEGEKINRINRFLLQNGIAPSEYNLEERDLQYTNKLDLIAERLKNHVTVPSVENWVKKDFNMNRLKTEALIAISITNHPFNTPKIKMSLDKASFKKTTLRDTREELEEDRVRIVNELQGFAETIETGKNNYPDVIDSEFTDIIDDRPFTTEEGYANKKLNVNILTDISKSKKPKAVVDTYGKEFFKSLESKLNQLKEIERKEREVGQKIKINRDLEKVVEQQRKEACTS